MSLWSDVAVVMSLFTSSWSWRVSWCLNCVTWTPTTRNLQISNMISALFQNSNFWILPVFSLELVGHIHQRGGTRLRNSGKNMTLPCYQFYNDKEMGPEGEYDCKKIQMYQPVVNQNGIAVSSGNLSCPGNWRILRSKLFNNSLCKLVTQLVSQI